MTSPVEFASIDWMSFPAALPFDNRADQDGRPVAAPLVWPADDGVSPLPALADLVCASTEEMAELAGWR